MTVTASSAATATSAAAAASSTASASDIGNFGSCSVPQIEFGVGFDNRKETSFEPVDKTSYDHGSAQAIGIISQFICDQLTNKCGADATAKATCAKAITAANGGTAKTGVQADLFNAVFGITTTFADVPSVDDQGNVVAGTGSAAAQAAIADGSSGIGDFGSCSTPQIEFGVGFDNRKETSFEPVDKTSYDHGSAQAIGIISQFICDTLTNKCGADATAKATCAKAITAANTGAAKTGVQADLFNAVFGITTNFANVAVVDDQGRTVSSGSATSAASDSAATSVAATTTAAAAAATTAASSSSSAIGDFGSCSVPQIEFGVGFDNRKETSFEPVDKTSYDHGSAQAIGIITQFICDTLTNKCGADATAKATCAKAITAANTGAAKTGVQADLFNAVFGITTDFANTPVVSDTGVTISGGSATSAAASSVAAATTTSAAAAATSSAAAVASGSNLQTFTGALGGVTPPAVTANADGSFQVSGNASFKDLSNALTRSCDVQHNQCANAANASGNKGDLTVDACGTQQTQCDAAH